MTLSRFTEIKYDTKKITYSKLFMFQNTFIEMFPLIFMGDGGRSRDALV